MEFKRKRKIIDFYRRMCEIYSRFGERESESEENLTQELEQLVGYMDKKGHENLTFYVHLLKEYVKEYIENKDKNL